MVPVMIDSVGIRKSVRDTSRTMISRRTDRPTLRRIDPITKPMNWSMLVHSTPQMTWTNPVIVAGDRDGHHAEREHGA